MTKSVGLTINKPSRALAQRAEWQPAHQGPAARDAAINAASTEPDAVSSQHKYKRERKGQVKHWVRLHDEEDAMKVTLIATSAAVILLAAAVSMILPVYSYDGAPQPYRFAMAR